MRTFVVFTGTTLVLVLALYGLASCAGSTSTQVQSTTPPATIATYAPPPTTLAPDTPKYSTEEMTAMLWNKLPDDLPPGFQKSQFEPTSGNASYIANGKWQYQVMGQIRLTDLLPTSIYEKTPDYWVEEHSWQVYTRNLLLAADYFENSGTLSLQPVQVVSENTTVEVLSQTAVIPFKLKLNWINGSTTGYNLCVEGAFVNTGTAALQNIVFEVTSYDYAGKYLRTDNITISPSKIEIGATAGFSITVPGVNLKKGPNGSWGYYDYRFLTSTGKVITVQK
ncbi:MAG TPA: hypothetical protein VMB24_06380 [Dehalococcoidales bacterium]|nr:hypothetical protein [Dehalococcoidales bacterium]